MQPARVSQTALIAATLILAVLLGIWPLQNYDFWMHLASGRHIVEQGRLPYEYPFGYTAAAKEWIDQEWLSQTLLYRLYMTIGVDGLVFLKAALGAAAVGATLWLSLRRRVPVPEAVALALVAVLLVRNRLTVRPHVVTLVLLSFWALLLGGWGRRRWVAVVLAVSTVAWANLHAGFLAGLILLGLHWLDALWRWARSPAGSTAAEAGELRWFSVMLLACILATFINPYGPRLWTYPFSLVTMRIYMKYIEEWMRPALSPRYYLFFGYLAVGSLILLWQRRKIRLVDGLIWIVFGGMALSARRHIAPFALISTPVMAAALSRFAFIRRGERVVVRLPLTAITNLAVAVLLVVVGVRSVLTACPHPLRPGIRPRFFPTGGARYLRAHSDQLPRQLYNSYVWGGYLEWELDIGAAYGGEGSPPPSSSDEKKTDTGWKVFVDGECVVFGEKVFTDWDTVYLLQRGWRRVLDSYDVNCIIRDWGLGNPEPLIGSGRWVTVYWDDVAMVLVRRQAADPRFIAENDFSLTNPAWLLRHIPVGEATYEKAYRQLDEAERRFGPSGIGRHMRGALLFSQGRFEEALNQFELDLQIAPEPARSWSAAGDCLRRLGRDEEAMAYYRVAIGRNPGLVYARIHLATLYEKLGDLDAAIDQLETVLGLAFDDPQLREDVASKLDELEVRQL